MVLPLDKVGLLLYDTHSVPFGISFAKYALSGNYIVYFAHNCMTREVRHV